MALQRLLPVIPQDTIEFLIELATKGNCFQQRASIAAIAEPSLLQDQAMIDAALAIQRFVLERLHELSTYCSQTRRCSRIAPIIGVHSQCGNGCRHQKRDLL